MIQFNQLMEDEYSKQVERGRECHSWHEGYGLILEELDEFWEEVRKKPSKRNRIGALMELVQIAALCRRVAEDLRLQETQECAKCCTSQVLVPSQN